MWHTMMLLNALFFRFTGGIDCSSVFDSFFLCCTVRAASSSLPHPLPHHCYLNNSYKKTHTLCIIHYLYITLHLFRLIPTHTHYYLFCLSCQMYGTYKLATIAFLEFIFAKVLLMRICY